MAQHGTKLSDEAIQQQLAQLVTWEVVDGQLRRQFRLPTFPAAIFFVNAVAHLAELGAHHPDMLVEYNKVTLRFVTHSAGGITEKDFAMARKVDELWQVLNWTADAPLK